MTYVCCIKPGMHLLRQMRRQKQKFCSGKNRGSASEAQAEAERKLRQKVLEASPCFRFCFCFRRAKWSRKWRFNQLVVIILNPRHKNMELRGKNNIKVNRVCASFSISVVLIPQEQLTCASVSVVTSDKGGVL